MDISDLRETVSRKLKNNTYTTAFTAVAIATMGILLGFAGYNVLEVPGFCKYSCDNQKPHSMCIYDMFIPDESCGQCFAIGLNEVERNLVLYTHNTIRYESVSNINDENKDLLWLDVSKPNPLPNVSSELAELQWDVELQQIAQCWANQCNPDFDDCRDTLTMKVGQNVASTQRGSIHFDVSLLVEEWWQELHNMEEDVIKKFRHTTPSAESLTRMLWNETKYVGCGSVKCRKNGIFTINLVCNYAPAGNIVGHPVYETIKTGS